MKTIKYLAMVALVALMGVTMTSCGGYSNGKAKDMIVKDNDGKLEEEDYTTMIEWLQDYNEGMLEDMEGIIEDNKDDYQQFRFAVAEMEADKNAEYIFIDDINRIVASAGEKKMGKENKENYDKLSAKWAERAVALAKKAPEKK